MNNSPYYEIARKNHRLSNWIYKRILKLNYSLLPNMGINKFREAFHSTTTSSELRALLLRSVFTDKAIDIGSLLKDGDKRTSVNKAYFGIDRMVRGNKPYLAFTHSAKRSAPPKEYKLSNTQIMDVRSWIPLNKTQSKTWLLRSIESGNVHNMKLVELLSNVGVYAMALSDLLYTNTRLNHPNKRYYTSGDPREDKNSDDELPSHTTSSHKQSIYRSHIQHMKNEFLKYRDKLNKIGIDTVVFEGEMNRLIKCIDDFLGYSTLYERDNSVGFIDEYDRKFTDIFDQSDVLHREATLMFEKVESYNLKNKNAYKIGRLEVIEEFVDYNQSKLDLRKVGLERGFMNYVRGNDSKLQNPSRVLQKRGVKNIYDSS